VTAACLASGGHDVVAIDDDAELIAGLRESGKAPVAEPGLQELTRQAIAAGHLRFTTDAAAVGGCDVVWIAFDTPVDQNDVADIDFVLGRCTALFPHLTSGSVMLVSSQLPVGSTHELARRYAELNTGRDVRFAYSPENLRLGKAIEVFTRPDRVVVGCDSEDTRSQLANIWEPFHANIIWMSIKSAEMTKHALNAFLATSVVFINEIAVLCEQAGANALEVEQGLKSDARIGPRAYLHPGSAFAGGTLARDVAFLRGIAAGSGVTVSLLDGVKASNDEHRKWLQRKVASIAPDLRKRRVAMLGLTYKPGTDTLRRSSAVEAALWLSGEGAEVRAYDPAVQTLPPELAGSISLMPSASDALDTADVAVVATEWPHFRELTPDDILTRMRSPVVVDAGRYLDAVLGQDGRIAYYSIGRG
jgi:UDPglucose 6-dehydrogenase